MAIKDGYRSSLTDEQIADLKAQATYPGYYRNGSIWVIEQDLGISGTKGQEGRPGLALMTQLIETHQIESVYVVDINRLFRDTDLVHASSFGHLCKATGTMIVTESMRFDLRNDMHYNFFLQMAQFACQELKTIMQRLGNSRALKSQMGLYAGGNVAAGFFVDLDPKSPTFEQYRVYPPHAEVIRQLFQMAVEEGSVYGILREVHRRGLYFPTFEAQIGVWMNSRV